MLGMCVWSSMGDVRHAVKLGPVVRAGWGNVVSTIRVRNWGHGMGGYGALRARGALTISSELLGVKPFQMVGMILLE